MAKYLALITGAGSGIGRATCQLLACRGVTVVAADIAKNAVDETVGYLKGKGHMGLELDVTKVDNIYKVMRDIIARYSRPPNINVNCAGVMLFQSFLDLTEDGYNQVFDVNVKGTIFVSHAVSQELVNFKNPGVIINVTSVAKIGIPALSVYGATKGAIETFTLAAAKELAPHNIRVNAVAPGVIETPMIDSISSDWLTKHDEKHPMHRKGTAEEVAAVIDFLASEKCSYCSGSSVYVHGGIV